MDTFEWSELFETGIKAVDEQHQCLVDLVNQLSHASDEASTEQIDLALKELADYTVYHFQCEEAIMLDGGVSPSHVVPHQETHRHFICQVSDWIEQRNKNEAPTIHQMLDVLSNWLIFHILGDDQSFARQINSIRKGRTAQDAFDNDHASDDPRTEILLDALHHLYSDLAKRNDELSASQQSLSLLNATLEQRVQERTAQLAAVNRMEALGSLAGGIAHEINTPTQYVRDNITFLQEGIGTLLGIADEAKMLRNTDYTVESLLQKLDEAELDYLKSELPAAADQARAV